MKTKKISILLLAVMVVLSTITAWCEAEELRVVKTYYLLKYEYRNFIAPLINQGVTDSELAVFFHDVESELKKIDGVNKDNIESNLSKVLVKVATFNKNSNVASAVLNTYNDEIYEYMETAIVPRSLEEVYAAVVRSLFNENETDKSELVEVYEKYRDVFNAGLSGYTAASVSNLEAGLRNALSVLRDASASQSDINKARKELEKSYSGLEKKVNNSGGSGGSGGSSGNISIPSAPQNDISDASDEGDAIIKAFSDVAEEYWGYAAIVYLTRKGILNGFEDNSFRPNDEITREQFATILCKAFKLPIADQNVFFADVKSNAWYVSYVVDVAESGLMQGLGDGNFGVGSKLLRQDLAVIANRLVQNGIVRHDFVRGSAIDFADKDQISGYALDSVIEMQSLGIINGMGDNLFAPKAYVTRAQAAQIIYSLIKD